MAVHDPGCQANPRPRRRGFASRDLGRRDGSRRNRIRYDASRFAVVEVDATFYGLPIAATSQRWMERTPDDARVRYQGSTLQPSETKRLREAVF